jgi:serine/threonine protein kinase
MARILSPGLNTKNCDKEFTKMKSSERFRLKTAMKELKMHSVKCNNLLFTNEMILSNDLKSLYIISDYFGEDSSLKSKLDHHLANGIFIEEHLVSKWFRESVSAFDYLHSNGILHSNIKLTNFLLDQSQSIRVADFGYLNLFNTSMVVKVDYMSSYLKCLTQESSSSRYLPRETFESFRYEFASEVYALGAIFYEILCLEKYEWTKEGEKMTINRSLKDKFFLKLLKSCLSNQISMRPSFASLKKYCDWQSKLDLLDLLQTGTFSLTFMCKTSSNSRRMKIYKQIDLNQMQDPSLGQVLVKSLNSEHQNVLKLDNFIFVDNNLLVLTDFLHNGSLQQRIEEQIMDLKGVKFAEGLIVQWLMQILNGLSHLHESIGILHGNLKCENVLFTSSNTIKLTDFGFYHLLNNGSSRRRSKKVIR